MATIAFRVDSGLKMASGHLMRCVTLARALLALKDNQHQVVFICRPQPGDMIAWLQEQGFAVFLLKNKGLEEQGLENQRLKEQALDSQGRGAKETADLLKQHQYIPQWVVVDHYDLDAQWHSAFRDAFHQVFQLPSPQVPQLLVIDDLANRAYDCNLLLDQNLGRTTQNYQDLTQAKVLAGLDYVLLRPEFAQMQAQVQVRQQLHSIIVTMGGVDQAHATGVITDCLEKMLREDATNWQQLQQVTFVYGASNPHWDTVIQQYASPKIQKQSNIQKQEKTTINQFTVQIGHCRFEFVRHVDNMAERFAQADLAIGAAGSTSWERCALGLPTFIVSLAPNQDLAAQALEEAGAAIAIQEAELSHVLIPLLQELNQELAQEQDGQEHSRLARMSATAMSLVDGQGCQRVIQAMGLV